MTLNRSFKSFASLAIALLAVCFTANLATANSAYFGKFTLPFEAHWGPAVLPAGNYSFTLDHGYVGGTVTIRNENGKPVGSLLSQGGRDEQALDISELVLVRSGENYTIRALRIADLGLTLEYSMPKGGGQLISQGPQLLERIPVMGMGKGR